MITVAILNRNGKDVIERCVKCVKSQTHPINEILLVDNDSNDDSWKLVEKDVDTIFHASNKYGMISGINTAFEQAKYNQVLFVSNDIFLHTQCLEAMVGMNSHIISPRTYTENGKRLRNFTFSTGCFLMKKSTFDFIGKFDENLAPAYGEDLDYMIRAKRMDFDIGEDWGKAIHVGSHTFSKQINKKEISNLCRDHFWYVLKKHYPNRVLNWLCSVDTFLRNRK